MEVNKDIIVGVDIANSKDETVVWVNYYHTFSVNPYICKTCGRNGFAMELVLCDQKVGMGDNIVCEECALQSGIKIKDCRGASHLEED